MEPGHHHRQMTPRERLEKRPVASNVAPCKLCRLRRSGGKPGKGRLPARSLTQRPSCGPVGSRSLRRQQALPTSTALQRSATAPPLLFFPSSPVPPRFLVPALSFPPALAPLSFPYPMTKRCRCDPASRGFVWTTRHGNSTTSQRQWRYNVTSAGTESSITSTRKRPSPSSGSTGATWCASAPPASRLVRAVAGLGR